MCVANQSWLQPGSVSGPGGAREWHGDVSLPLHGGAQGVQCGASFLMLALAGLLVCCASSAGVRGPEMVGPPSERGERDGVCLVENSPTWVSNRLWNSMRVMVCPRALRFQTGGQGGQGAGSGFFNNVSAPRQPKGNRETVPSLQAQALEPP